MTHEARLACSLQVPVLLVRTLSIRILSSSCPLALISTKFPYLQIEYQTSQLLALFLLGLQIGCSYFVVCAIWQTLEAALVPPCLSIRSTAEEYPETTLSRRSRREWLGAMCYLKGCLERTLRIKPMISQCTSSSDMQFPLTISLVLVQFETFRLNIIFSGRIEPLNFLCRLLCGWCCRIDMG